MPSPAAEPSTEYFAGLLGRLQAADPAARPDLHRQLVNAAYERARQLTRTIIRGNLGLRAGFETDDIVQDSMLVFSQQVEAICRNKSDPREVFAQLCAIIRRRAIDDVRKKRGPKHRTQFPAADIAAVNETAVRPTGPDEETVELQLVINELVDGLPPADQELVNLAFLERWSLPTGACRSIRCGGRGGGCCGASTRRRRRGSGRIHPPVPDRLSI